jgi:hypothetical protein
MPSHDVVVLSPQAALLFGMLSDFTSQECGEIKPAGKQQTQNSMIQYHGVLPFVEVGGQGAATSMLQVMRVTLIPM